MLLFTDLTVRYIVEKVITHVIMKTVKSNSSEITERIFIPLMSCGGRTLLELENLMKNWE